MKKKTLLALSLAWVLVQAAAALSAEKSLRVSFAAPATTYLPLWAAKDAGFFDKHKLTVELVHIGSSPIAVSALLAGETDILGGGGTVGPTLYLQGNRDLAFFARLNNKFVFAIYAHPSITDVAGLRGKKFGVTRFGGTMDFATRYFLRNSGLDPRKDLYLIQIGQVPDILRALLSGSIDAGTVSFPHHIVAKKEGFREITNLSKSGTRYASTAFLAKRSFLLNNKPGMENFIKAVTEAIHYVKTNRNESLRILSRYTRITDMDVLGQDYDFHVENIWPRVPEIVPEDLKLIIEELAERNPRAREIDLSQLIYGDLVKEVVKSGLADRLYK